MSHPKYIDEDELEGRTVAKVIVEGYCLYMAFTDGTWTCFSVDYSNVYYSGEMPEIGFAEPAADEDRAALFAKLGLPAETPT